MKFKYNFTPASTDKIPFVDIQLKNLETGATVGYRAMLDSGAFMSVFHSEVASLLDINLDQIKRSVEFQGVGDKVADLVGKVVILKVSVFQKGKSFGFDAPVLFSDNIDKNSVPLLGRQGFFDKFREVSFNYEFDKFYLETK